ncbi:unnamed protein product [Staurois parvus]|uniref:Uncharacterized protein n=1 Tax=Staurois parvus TaxID=386267 RepID=A0ABN9E548_9NEOB|nr:unnamed protein product [Staurois parvus]
MGPLCPRPNSKKPMKKGFLSLKKMLACMDPASIWGPTTTVNKGLTQGRTDNSWGPRAIGVHGAPVSLPKLKKAYEKGTRGISWGPLLTPRALRQCPSF